MKTSVVLTLLSCMALLLTTIDARPSQRQLVAEKDTKEATDNYHTAAENFLKAMEKVSGKKSGARQLRVEEEDGATNEDTKRLAGKSSRHLRDKVIDDIVKGLEDFFDKVRADHKQAQDKSNTTGK
ncbi:hypothetical protein BBJ28_00022184 [Nothophytophthora sp. Chile5]|nr:hypothetical protein BBJ28_00022184 [Nothophytophthora sp. Chile5]